MNLMAVNEQLNVHYLDEPFKIEEMPLGNTIYVLDNYLESSLHKAVDIYMRNCSWQKSNQVNPPNLTLTGKMLDAFDVQRTLVKKNQDVERS